jgi:hypothetical protein
LEIPGAPDHGRRRAAVDDIDSRNASLTRRRAFASPIRIATEILHLNEWVLLLEGLFHWPDNLLDDKCCVKAELALFLGALDENLLALGGFEQCNVFDTCSLAQTGNTNEPGRMNKP